VHLADAVEVGNIFKLGTHFSESLGALYLDRDGRQRPVVMGSYGIGVGRLLACVAEEHSDERGLVLPITVAPFQVHLVSLAGPSTHAAESAELLYGLLQAQGIEVLYDDREESPGVKFADADLIGVPLRITIGERSLGRGGVEFKRRSSTEMRIVPVEAAASEAEAEVRALTAEVMARVQPVPYTG
jgi:prolyl-tRNA synthetase